MHQTQINYKALSGADSAYKSETAWSAVGGYIAIMPGCQIPVSNKAKRRRIVSCHSSLNGTLIEVCRSEKWRWVMPPCIPPHYRRMERTLWPSGTYCSYSALFQLLGCFSGQSRKKDNLFSCTFVFLPKVPSDIWLLYTCELSYHMTGENHSLQTQL